MVIPSISSFYQYETDHGAAAANRLLLSWLSNDVARNALYADMVKHQSPLFFSSNASKRSDQEDRRDYDWIDGPRDYYQKAVLLVHPKHIEKALTCSNALIENMTEDQIQAQLPYSNSPFQGLGGFFMLGIDDPKQHDAQRKFALDMLGSTSISPDQYDALATLAFKGGALVPLKQHDFDLVGLAESIAVRYATLVFGFAQKDIPLVQSCTRKIGRGLQYQMMARHFVFEPTTMIESRAALGQLGQRAASIMQCYVDGAVLTSDEEDEKEELLDGIQRLSALEFQTSSSTPPLKAATLKDFKPILQQMARSQASSGQGWPLGIVEKGLIAAGLVGGAVTNIQNAICICISQFFNLDSTQLITIRDQARKEYNKNPDAQWLADSKFLDWVKEALRVTPPAAFIPRRTNLPVDLDPVPKDLECCPKQHQKTIDAETLVLIGLGGACWVDDNQFRFEPKETEKVSKIDSEKNSACPFAKIYGGPPLKHIRDVPTNRWEYTHSCPGMMMAMYVIHYAVRQLMLLPSLTQKIDRDEFKPLGLEKRWGFQSVSYPMSYQREVLLKQTPLQTLLPIKTPVDYHSQALRQVIAQGAPFIEKVLQDSGMVHFASFVFMEEDSKLMLFTMYDGDFDSYIGHFAREFGYLFDRFFSHVAIQPPMPIREHPFEFVQYLKQFLQPSVENYYFSAYPEVSTAQITHRFTRQFDFNDFRGKR